MNPRFVLSSSIDHHLSSTMGIQSLILSKRFAILVAFLLTPIPKHLGIYQFLCSFHPFTIGIVPWSIANEQRWGFTFDDLYGDGKNSFDDDVRAKYRTRLWGQRAVVTGANSGIGYEISLALARLGVRVTMVCRNPKKCEAAANKIRQDEIMLQRNKADFEQGIIEVTTMIADMSSLKSVQKFSKEFLARNVDPVGDQLPLDMLFLNAGIGAADANEDGSLPMSEDGIELVFATNVVGHHLMYRLLEPTLYNEKGRITPARIVQTASCLSYINLLPYKVATDLETLNGVSEANRTTFHKDFVYPQSKLAQILWVNELTDRLDAANGDSNSNNPNSIVYVNAANPGAVATNIWADREEMPLLLKITCFWARFLQRLMWRTDQGALTLLYLGTAVEDLQAKKIRGQFYHPQSTRMAPHNLFKHDNEKNTKLLQENMWKFLDELVADFL